MIPQQVRTADGRVHERDFVNPQPYFLDANNANFRDMGDRVTLSQIGVFSIDGSAHRFRRTAQRLRAERIKAAYIALEMDQREEYARIAGEVIDIIPAGVWPQSTGEYATRRKALDDWALAQAMEG